MALRVLLLAGTAEAHSVAAGLARMAGVSAVASLAGVTRDPRPLPLPTRSGGFGGAEAMADWLKDAGIGAVVDATHPFAAVIGPRTAHLCAGLGIAYLRLLRPEWRPVEGDLWHVVPDAAGAAALIPAGATAFVTIGRPLLDPFDAVSRRARLLVRRLEPPEEAFPFPQGAWVHGRAPFTVDGEADLFRDLGVDWLVTKNAGGAGAWPKVEAARRLGIPVAMIARPPQPPGPVVARAEDALDWVRSLCPAG